MRTLILRLAAKLVGVALEGVTSSRVELQVECRHLRAELEAAVGRETYWRTRYERLADQRLFKQGDIHVPVHEELPKRESKGKDTTTVGALMQRLSTETINEKKHTHDETT